MSDWLYEQVFESFIETTLISHACSCDIAGGLYHFTCHGYAFCFGVCFWKFSQTPWQFETNPGRFPVPSLRNAVLRTHQNTFHKLNSMLSAAFVTLVGAWKSCIDITLSKPWNTDITVINGLLNQFWRSQESPKPSVPYRQKWEPAYCISMMFFPLNSIMGVCVFFLCPHHVMFSCEKCFINDLPRLHVSFEMLWQKLWVQEEKKNPLSSNGKLSSSGIRRLHQWRLIVQFPFSWFWSYNKGLCLILCDVVSSERKTILYF